MRELTNATPLTGADSDYDALLESIGNARFVLIGEASHGTHDFYAHRARITERLIREKGFIAVAAEADWPDAYQVNRHLMGGDGESPLQALEEFRRFPLWMWRNTVVRDFVRDLKAYNEEVVAKSRAGFYGLDLYSLHGSIAAVIEYLEGVDPDAAQRARDRYGCLESPDSEPQRYGMEASFGVREPCEDEAVAQLVELLRRAGDYTHRDGENAGDEFFFAEQNARLVVDAEAYYRAMFRGGRDDTWNRRDTHMADTLDALDKHLTRRNRKPAKIVVWAHNSHLGDARATDMGWERGELNLGQLTRTRHGEETFIVGFTTYTGTVTAANDWGAPARRMRVLPALAGSLEARLHAMGDGQDFVLDLRDQEAVPMALREKLLERAIGVVYRPSTERWSHYFHCDVAKQFDALIHLDTTSALEPLDRTSGWQIEPDTFPTGI